MILVVSFALLAIYVIIGANTADLLTEISWLPTWLFSRLGMKLGLGGLMIIIIIGIELCTGGKITGDLFK